MARRAFVRTLFFLSITLFTVSNRHSVEAASAAPRESDSFERLFKQAKTDSEDQNKNQALNYLKNKTPRTPDDIDQLAMELEGEMAPLAQAIIRKTTDAALVPSLIDILEKKPSLKTSKNRAEFDAMNLDQRKKEVQDISNAEVVIESLGNLKDRRSIPVLKSLLDNEALSYQASTALGKIGDPAILDELMERAEKQKDIDLSGFGDIAFKRVMAEIDDPGTSQEKRARLIGHIKGSKNSETKRALKNIALTHKDPEVREQAGLAYVNSILLGNGDASDPDFIIQWANLPTQNVDEEISRIWVFNAMDKTWTPRYIPILINMSSTSKVSLIKSKAADLFGRHKVQEAVPYLESVLKDKGLFTRLGRLEAMQVWRDACIALEKITGKKYFIEVYESDFPDWTTQLQDIKDHGGTYLWYKLVGKKRE